jgi:polyhydroxyalkanoate synthesis regulator phasin
LRHLAVDTRPKEITMLDALIRKFLQSQGPALIRSLVSKLGITSPQASTFLSALTQKAKGAVESGDADPKSLLAGDTESLLSKLDLDGLARETGIERSKAEAGAREVVPSLVAFAREHAGALGGLLGGKGAGGLGDMMKKAGGMFGGA